MLRKKKQENVYVQERVSEREGISVCFVVNQNVRKTDWCLKCVWRIF